MRKTLPIFILLFSLSACGEDTSDDTNNTVADDTTDTTTDDTTTDDTADDTTDDAADAPFGHTVNKNGVYHKEGLENPMANCTMCHGSDLQGGAVGVSCTSCHGEKW
ncbi:hypothetical protein KAI87_13600 [Myxococcota bacterium]|nr:hypothetical protein [Myxococcota bacterium]